MVTKEMTEIQYLGQNGFRILVDGLVLYFDLYLSNCVYELTGIGTSIVVLKYLYVMN